jgi:TonB family protein
VYTSHVNMPNLTSRTGSWVLRFAEHQGREQPGDLSTPYVVRKVDPTYEAGAQREHIEGVILLAAVVQIDGSISNVRVVRGLDSRLDLSAISAFTQWKFQPALRNGHPVELEVIVRIPFVNNY